MVEATRKLCQPDQQRQVVLPLQQDRAAFKVVDSVVDSEVAVGLSPVVDTEADFAATTEEVMAAEEGESAIKAVVDSQEVATGGHRTDMLTVQYLLPMLHLVQEGSEEAVTVPDRVGMLVHLLMAVQMAQLPQWMAVVGMVTPDVTAYMTTDLPIAEVAAADMATGATGATGVMAAQEASPVAIVSR